MLGSSCTSYVGLKRHLDEKHSARVWIYHPFMVDVVGVAGLMRDGSSYGRREAFKE